MREDILTQTISPAYGDDGSDFDKVLPPPIVPLDLTPARLELHGKLLTLDNSHKNAQYLYHSIAAALRSEWWQGLAKSSQKSIVRTLEMFLSWLSEQTITTQNRLALLKKYEAWRVNEGEVKPQSTGLHSLIKLLNEGMHAASITSEAARYLHALLNSTTLSVADERKPSTLTGFFAKSPWLRGVLGERDYLRLESPKLLMDSFSIVVATTLLLIIDTKQQSIARLKNPEDLGAAGKKNKNKEQQLPYYSRDLLLQLGQLAEDGQPADLITELLLLDSVPTDRRQFVLKNWHQTSRNKTIPLKARENEKDARSFLDPCLFAPEWLHSYSPIEQQLCAWLCAWQTVQSTDIGKLKPQNFAISRNQRGRAVSLQCAYYKGRSGRVQEPPVLSAEHIEAQALTAYLDHLPSETDRLFDRLFTNPYHLSFTSHCPISARLARLWQSPMIQTAINQQLKKRLCSPLFLNAFIAVAQHGGVPFDAWRSNKNKFGKDNSYTTYRLTSHHPLPQRLFNLGAIKTSAIHARTDQYRDNDLVNYNSHSAQTEKTSYLTDANKEWINQNGRLTRLVLHDIECYVFRPNLEAAVQTTHDLLLRTRVVDAVASGVEDPTQIRVNPIGRVDHIENIIDSEPDSIIVLDTTETVVNMLHYINEAEHQRDALIQCALPFFERTVLPNVEWMHYVLQQQLSPIVIRQGESDYQQIKSVLPSLFANELRGGVGA